MPSFFLVSALITELRYDVEWAMATRWLWEHRTATRLATTPFTVNGRSLGHGDLIRVSIRTAGSDARAQWQRHRKLQSCPV